MEKKIAIIREGGTFMVNAIQKNLEAAGYSVLPTDAAVAAVSERKKETDIFVLYLGNYATEAPDFLVYMKDLCAEEEKPLILLGNPAELSAVCEYIPPALVSARFERPLDIKKLVEELNRLALINDENAHRKSILLVDDDSSFLKTVKGWLSEKYRVTIVTSGTQALMYIADNTPDLILLDYEMPVTSGPQVLEMIRSETKVGSIPVIFLTGKDDRESVMKVLALKPDGYLLKNTDRDGLLKSVGEFFEKRKYEHLRGVKA